MILCFDIGNSQTSVALFGEDKNPIKTWFFATKKDSKSADYLSDFEFFNKHSNFEKLDSVVVGSVVPNLANDIKEKVKLLSENFEHPLRIKECNAQTVCDIDSKYYDCKYPIKEEVGSDIIASILAARYYYGGPCAIADLGTATNINVIDKEGGFLGAVICSGLKTSLRALIGDASALEDTQIQTPSSILGNNTMELIQSGVVFGEAAKVEGIVNRIEEYLGYKVNVITTGGWSNLVSPHLNIINECVPELVLQGLKVFDLLTP